MTVSNFTGSGLLRPFQRDGKGDFANAEGATLVQSVFGQILGTRASSAASEGELPWRTEAGSLLYTIKHRNNTAVTRERARVFVQDAIRRHDKRIEILDVDVVESERTIELNQIVLRIRWRLVDRNRTGNQVLVEPQTTEVNL